MTLLRITTLAISLFIAGCTGDSEEVSSEQPDSPEESAHIQIEPWGDTPGSDLVAAARYAGLYAVADRASDSVTVFDVHQSPVVQISGDDLQRALPDGLTLHGDELGPVGLAFSSSGRLLFITVAGAQQGSVLRFNTHTNALVPFVQSLDFNRQPGTGNLGLTHHNGVLWVGTGDGQILRYQAGRNDKTGTLLSRQTLDGHSVHDITVDSADRKGYISTSHILYRLDTDSSSIEPLVSVAGLKAASFGRTYGGEGQGGLYLLVDGGAGSVALPSNTESSAECGCNPGVLR